MGANALAVVLAVFGLLLLFGDIPLLGVIFLACSVTVWRKRPEAFTLYSWLFTAAVAGVVLSWLFGGGGGGPDLGVGLTR